MSDNLIGIAKANGGKRWNGNDDRDLPSIILTDDQLSATVEQVCAPLVEALRKINYELPNLYAKSDVALANDALNTYRALIGDKHE